MNAISTQSNAIGQQAIDEGTKRVRKSRERRALETVASYLGITLKADGGEYALTFANGEERSLSNIELDALSDAFAELSSETNMFLPADPIREDPR